MEGAKPFGVISGTAEETRITFFKKDALAAFAWRESFSSADATRLFRFEARCDAWRLKGDIDPASTSVIPDESRNCRVFVFGAEGAEFEFVESAGRRDATAAASAPATGSG